MGGGVDFFTKKKEALRQFMDRETYEKFMKYPSQRGITQHPLLHDQGEVLSVSPSIGLSNPSLRNGTLCFLRPRSSLVLVRCPRSVKTPLCVCLVQNIFRCYVVVAAPQLPPFSFFMSRPEWKQNYDVLSSSLVNSNPKYSKPYNFAIIEVYDNHGKPEIQQTV